MDVNEHRIEVVAGLGGEESIRKTGVFPLKAVCGVEVTTHEEVLATCASASSGGKNFSFDNEFYGRQTPIFSIPW